jgi:hypothetical protein
MRLILSIIKTGEMLNKIILLAIHANLVGWWLLAAIIFDKLLQLLNTIVFKFDILLSFPIDSIVGIQLLLQLNNGFVPLVKPTGQSNHDVSLFKEQLFVSIHLLLVLLDLYPFFLDFLHFLVVLFSDQPLSLFQRRSELRGVLDLLTTFEHLGVHRLDLLLKELALLLLLHEFAGSELQSCDGSIFVFFCSFFFVFDFA